MSRMNEWIGLIVLLIGGALAQSADAPRSVQWSAKDIKGAAVSVPADRPSVLAFIRADQDLTRQVLAAIQKTVVDTRMAQVVLIFSGPLAEKQAQQQAWENSQNWPIVADSAFSASGKLNIHVWPTTLVINPTGQEVAHLAGATRNFSQELEAYLALAAGKIDKQGLEQRLTTREVIIDGPRERAARHVRMAQQFFSQERTSQAKAELDKALALQPDDAASKLLMSKLLVAEGKPAEALKAIEGVDPASTSGWRIGVGRLRVLIALGRWDEAKALASEVTKLNPDPGEAHYLSGLVWAHSQDWEKAAAAFRSAYEAVQSTKPQQ